MLDRLPGSGVEIATPSWWWVLAAEAAGFGMMLGRTFRFRLFCAMILVMLWVGASTVG